MGEGTNRSNIRHRAGYMFKHTITKLQAGSFLNRSGLGLFVGHGWKRERNGHYIVSTFSPEEYHHLLGVAYRWVGSALSP